MNEYDTQNAVAHVVMFSSGAGSWAAAKRTVERHGAQATTLLFADVKGNNPDPHAGEDEDNYRFLDEAARNVGAELVVLNEGRDIWQVYFDEHTLGSTRFAPCSKQLKQLPARRWMDEHYPDPTTVRVVVGIDWTEEHRLEPNRKGWAPYEVEAPLCDKPMLDKAQTLDWLAREGIAPPRLYDLGFSHANCGGFCCRMGQAQAVHLLRTMPERYAYHEAKEQEFRDHFGFAFIRDRRGGVTKPFTLKALREREETTPGLFDSTDWGSCGCFTAGLESA